LYSHSAVCVSSAPVPAAAGSLLRAGGGAGRACRRALGRFGGLGRVASLAASCSGSALLGCPLAAAGAGPARLPCPVPVLGQRVVGLLGRDVQQRDLDVAPPLADLGLYLGRLGVLRQLQPRPQPAAGVVQQVADQLAALEREDDHEGLVVPVCGSGAAGSGVRPVACVEW